MIGNILTIVVNDYIMGTNMALQLFHPDIGTKERYEVHNI